MWFINDAAILLNQSSFVERPFKQKLDLKDSSHKLQYAISYLFYLYLIHATRFNVTRNLKNFTIFLKTKQDLVEKGRKEKLQGLPFYRSPGTEM